jgi:hypothetical protein
MDSLKERLDREIEGLQISSEALAKTVARARRRSRNKRIAAGVVGIAVFVAAVWIVTSGLSFDRSQTPAVPGGSETGPTETGPSVAPDPSAEGIRGLPLEGATPSTPERGELVVELYDPTIPGGSREQVWVYADGRVISRLYLRTLEPYSGLVEQHITPEGVEFLRSNLLSTGLFEHDLELVREDQYCCFEIRVRDGDRLVRVYWGPRYTLSDHQAPKATSEQVTALESLSALLTSPASWPASVWADQKIRAYVPTSYSVCSRAIPQVEPSRVLALLPEPARDLLGAGFLKKDGSDCSRMTTEEARALAVILSAEFSHEGGPSLGFSLETPEVPGHEIGIAFNPVLPHGQWPSLAAFG